MPAQLALQLPTLPSHHSCSATTYSVVKTFYNSTHALGKTMVISLLQPPPEVVQLFDDILLLTDGRVVYQ